MTSKSVPPATKSIMATTYACIIIGEIDDESSEKGLIVNIKLPHG
jgi:hypothetical protein